MDTSIYQIVPSESKIDRYLHFFSKVKILKHLSTNTIFARYILISNNNVNPTSGWEITEIELPAAYVKTVGAGQVLQSVVDEFGNIYYDVTKDFLDLL